MVMLDSIVATNLRVAEFVDENLEVCFLEGLIDFELDLFVVS